MGKRKNETREEYNERNRKLMSARYYDTVEFLRLFKTEKGCADCGYNQHHAGLQFDHVIARNGDEGKRISRLAARGIPIVMKHIEAECEVVCSTCHSIRTWERSQQSIGS